MSGHEGKIRIRGEARPATNPITKKINGVIDMTRAQTLKNEAVIAFRRIASQNVERKVIVTTHPKSSPSTGKRTVGILLRKSVQHVRTKAVATLQVMKKLLLTIAIVTQRMKILTTTVPIDGRNITNLHQMMNIRIPHKKVVLTNLLMCALTVAKTTVYHL